MAHHSNHTHPQQKPVRRAPHKDWRVWTAVVLMLAAMAAYVLTMDEAEVPNMQPPQANQDAGIE